MWKISSAIPANALILSSYKTTNPSLLRRRSPTILAKSRSDYSSKKGPEIVEPCFIHEDAQVDPSAKIGPNVSIGQGVKIGAGCRVKESIVLDNTVLDVSELSFLSGSRREIGKEGGDRGEWNESADLFEVELSRVLLYRNTRACCTRSLERIVNSDLGLE